MKKVASRSASWAAAATLSVFTLGVFYLLQDYGPQSVLRRFHHGVRTGDLQEIQGTIEQPLDDPNVREIVPAVHQFLLYGEPTTVGMERDLRRGAAQVNVVDMYEGPAGERKFPIVWVVEKRDRLWRINVDKTATILKDYVDLNYMQPQ